MMESGIPVTMNVEPANSGNSNGGFGGWGGDGAWFLIILFLFIFCGWGGGYGGFGGMGGGANSPGLNGFATRADINEGFALNNLQSGINAIQQGICDASYALNNALNSGFNTTNMNMMQGFNGVQSQICSLGAQLQQCCCNIQTLIQEVNYNMAKNTCDLQNTMNMNTRDQMENTNTGIRAILEKLSQMEYNGLNDKYQAALAENQALRFAASQTAQNAFISANQEAQTAELIRRLGADCPQPAYVVQPPQPVSFPLGCNGQLNVWSGNTCGQCG